MRTQNLNGRLNKVALRVPLADPAQWVPSDEECKAIESVLVSALGDDFVSWFADRFAQVGCRSVVELTDQELDVFFNTISEVRK